MCKAGRVTIAEVEEIVDEITPEDVHVPSIYVKRVVLGKNYQKRIEKRTVRKVTQATESGPKKPVSPAKLVREKIARRAALEFKQGMYGKGVALLDCCIALLSWDNN